jgi:hypothetical protein
MLTLTNPISQNILLVKDKLILKDCEKNEAVYIVV